MKFTINTRKKKGRQTNISTNTRRITVFSYGTKGKHPCFLRVYVYGITQEKEEWEYP